VGVILGVPVGLCVLAGFVGLFVVGVVVGVALVGFAVGRFVVGVLGRRVGLDVVNDKKRSSIVKFVVSV